MGRFKCYEQSKLSSRTKGIFECNRFCRYFTIKNRIARGKTDKIKSRLCILILPVLIDVAGIEIVKYGTVVQDYPLTFQSFYSISVFSRKATLKLSPMHLWQCFQH